MGLKSNPPPGKTALAGKSRIIYIFFLLVQVCAGLLDDEEGSKRGLCYAREIDRFREMTAISVNLGDKVPLYIDVDAAGENVDDDLRTVYRELKKTVQEKGIPTKNYPVNWHKEVSWENARSE